MSTRSSIAVQHADGTVDAVYCHFDGYLLGVGAALLSDHNSLEAAERLVELGHLSKVCGGVEAYARDRGEKAEDNRPIRFGSLADYGAKVVGLIFDNGYRYLWAEGKWQVWGRRTLAFPLVTEELGLAVARAREAERG